MKITYNEKLKAEIEKSQKKLAQQNTKQDSKRPEKELDCNKLATNKRQYLKNHRELGM